MDFRARSPVKFVGLLSLAGASALVCSATSLGAQNVDSLRALYTIELPPLTNIAATAARTAPGSSASSPSAYGANWGNGFVGVGGQARTRYTPERLPDGSAVVGFGLGNARDHLGVEVALTSLSTFRQGFGTNYSASFKIHRALPKSMGFAVGWENAIHNAGTDGGRSLYGVVSSVIAIRSKATDALSTLTLSLGAGNGRFRSEKDVQADEERVNVFGSAGLRVFEWVSVIADWTGQDLVAALSVVPFIRVPLIITPGIADLTGSAGDGARFVMGAGMGFRFRGLGTRRDRAPSPGGPAGINRPDPRAVPPMESPPAAEPPPINATLLKLPVHFYFDDASLTPAAREALDSRLALFAAYPSLAISIESHTAADSRDEYGIDLDRRRAASVRDYLVGRGVQAARIYLGGFGEPPPVCMTPDDPCRQFDAVTQFRIQVGPP